MYLFINIFTYFFTYLTIFIYFLLLLYFGSKYTKNKFSFLFKIFIIFLTKNSSNASLISRFSTVWMCHNTAFKK